jgi:hypothetical protein
MRLAGVALRHLLPVCALLGSAGAASAFEVPSGQTVELQDVLLDESPGTLWVRFRFIAPAIGPQAADQVPVDTVFDDMAHLCTTLAVPYLSQEGIDADRIAISMSDRAVAFGAPAPDATQMFEIYRPDGADCIWEEY